MSPEIEHFDVIVVGYGPGAQTLVAQLAKLGRKVCALERYPHLYNLPRAGHVDHEAIRIAQSVGDVRPAVQTMWEVRDPYYWLNAAGQVLMEDKAYDAQGQVLTGSFMDYAMPRAEHFCPVVIEDNPVPTPTNPLGVKGAGEAGTVGSLSAGVNAIVDALSHLGIRHVPMPATPERLWRVMQNGRAKGA